MTALRTLALLFVCCCPSAVVAFSLLPPTTTITTTAIRTTTFGSCIRPSLPKTTTTTALNGGGSGFASSPAGKVETVEKVKGMLDASEMVFSMPCSSLKVSQMQKLRLQMPETTTVKIVKNTLMERAVEGTPYQVMLQSDLLTGANMWFFVEDDIGGTISAVNAFVKEQKIGESHSILGGILEQTVYDSAGVEAIGKLPSKLELYARIAGAIKALPTKVARVIKAPSTKLARAIQLATAEDKDDKE